MSRRKSEDIKPNITHVLADGTVLKDITGHVVKYEDCPEFYHTLIRIARKREK